MNINQEIAELRVRVKALETGATCPHIVSSDEGTSYCDLALQTATSQPALAAALAPAGGLVERVAGAIGQELSPAAEARAAIREVAAYMQENYADTDWVTTAAVACVIADLKEESDR